MADIKNASELLAFIKKSPSCFHAVSNIVEILKAKGFIELNENERWKVAKGKSYFVKRNNSSIIAFSIPEDTFSRFLICASHSDSPCFKIKENPEMLAEDTYVRLNVEKYGGMLCAPWFDRPLSVAGRLILKTDSPLKFEEKLVSIDEDLLIIPNLAIHMNREANDGMKYNVQNDMLPVFSCNKEIKLVEYVAESAGVSMDEVKGSDLFLYCRDEGTFIGADRNIIASPRLDDLECAWTTLQGFIDSKNESAVKVFCVFDNEEVGSLTRQGADSTFMEDVLRRINSACGRSEEDFHVAVSDSFMISADNAHALHPNHSSIADPVNRPMLNKGPVIKFNAAQKYTTDGVSSAMFRSVCEKAGVPVQVYTNRSDIAGGSTLGNLSNAHVSLRCVDIGLAQWAMHSPYETAGVQDVDYMISAVKEFYSAE
ncbi:M18 family aminopeptidase [Treponema sp.]|uniref:M18 family aminopeptidase n=1 Tax=Treponema sp. TaxID=166 RepID=UPI00389076FF